jgi:murein L,D-transpeptidase YcbB/YkuD
MKVISNRGLTRRGWLAAGVAAGVTTTALAGCDRLGRRAPPGPEAGLTDDQGQQILKALAEAPSQGFSPAAFPTSGLAEALKGRDDAARAAVRRKLAAEAIAYAGALHGFAIPKSAMDPNWGLRPAAYDAEAEFRAALAQNRLEPWLAALPPQDAGYQALRSGYQVYLKIAASGGWPAVPEGGALKPGSRGPRVAALRQRLGFEAPAVARAAPDAPYDAALVQAVSDFQARHGLHVTGAVDAPTLAALNVPAIARAAQVRANLERRRWSPRNPPATRIEVNSAGQTFQLYLEGQPAMHMLVAAGRPGDETPILASKIQTVVLNPTWNVPDGIADEELRPKGAAYLQAHDFIEQDGRLVQQPGPDNALGRVKFLFPNRYSVYLHDTPAKSAFDLAQRSVSHGCVRLEKALDLAKLLLGRFDGWPPDRVDQVLAGHDTENIDLKQPVPVYLQYFTAWPEGDQLAFRDDIYGWDQETLKALDAAQVKGA